MKTVLASLLLVFLCGCLEKNVIPIPGMVFKIGHKKYEHNGGLERVNYHLWQNTWQWFCNNGMRTSQDKINYTQDKEIDSAANPTP